MRLLTLALALATPVFAHVPFCVTGMAALAGSESAELTREERDALIQSTFDSLLEQMGGSRVTPELVAVWEKSGKPFTLPETREDLGGLRTKLAAFEKMLEDKGWNETAVRQMLLVGLKKRRQGQNVARVRLEEAMSEDINLGDFSKPLGTVVPVAVSPSGKWAFSTSLDALPGHPDAYSLTLVNTHERKAQSLPLPKALYSTVPFFLPDGTAVFPKSNRGLISFVPFANGEFDWAKASTPFGPMPNREQEPYFFPTDDANVYFGSIVGNDVLRYDLATGKRTPVAIPYDLKGKSVWGHGTTPNKNRIHMLVKEDVGFVLAQFEYDANGTLRQVESGRKMSEYQGPLTASFDGSVLFSTGSNSSPRLTAFPESGPPVSLSAQNGSNQFPGYVLHAVPHPMQNWAIVFSDSHGTGRNCTVDVVDLNTRQSRRQFVLPFVFSEPPIVTPSGRNLIGRDRQQTLRVVDLSRWAN